MKSEPEWALRVKRALSQSLKNGCSSRLDLGRQSTFSTRLVARASQMRMNEERRQSNSICRNAGCGNVRGYVPSTTQETMVHSSWSIWT